MFAFLIIWNKIKIWRGETRLYSTCIFQKWARILHIASTGLVVLVPVHATTTSSRGVGCHIQVHAHPGPWRRCFLNHQIRDQVPSILGSSSFWLVSEVWDGDDTESTKTQCVVLLLTRLKGQVQHQPNDLVSGAHQKIAVTSRERILVGRIPVPTAVLESLYIWWFGRKCPL